MSNPELKEYVIHAELCSYYETRVTAFSKEQAIAKVSKDGRDANLDDPRWEKSSGHFFEVIGAEED